MVRPDGSMGIMSFREIPDDSFQVETRLSKFNHRTFLKYEATGDEEMFRIEIKHIFGRFDVNIPPRAAASQLLCMLANNTGSFGTTTAFIGAESQEGTIYATLNSFHHFLTSWSDTDIGKTITLHLFDMAMRLVTEDTSLTMLKTFVGHS
jgi:hypothetical protein